eukprot:762521-Hanusia_phi.AAC.32
MLLGQGLPGARAPCRKEALGTKEGRRRVAGDPARTTSARHATRVVVMNAEKHARPTRGEKMGGGGEEGGRGENMEGGEGSKRGARCMAKKGGGEGRQWQGKQAQWRAQLRKEPGQQNENHGGGEKWRL